MRILALAWCSFILAAGTCCLLAEDADAKISTFKGQVISLADLLKQDKIEVDQEAGVLLGLQTDDGKILPLVRDGMSRRFYNDAKLLNRPVQVRGRLVAKGSLLQLLEVHSIKQGHLYDMYYWCDVCSIRRDSLRPSKDCECCGGPMEFREVLVK